MQVFGMPTILAKSPLGASDQQKATFTQKVIGAALRVIGVTPGYDLDFKQASAEGSDTFTQAMQELERAVSILVWGTLGLISGGSGFSNSDLFERMKAAVIEKEARKQARFENEQIWHPVLDWAYRAGNISASARNAHISYNAESAAVIEQKAKAAKALVEIGYTPEEAQQRVGLEKHSMPEPVPQSGVQVSPEAREDAPEEPGYSEKLAATMTERSLSECPHGETRSCRSCRVVRRYEVQDGNDPYRPVWHPWTRRAA
jgi:phage gp29-like protein